MNQIDLHSFKLTQENQRNPPDVIWDFPKIGLEEDDFPPVTLQSSSYVALLGIFNERSAMLKHVSWNLGEKPLFIKPKEMNSFHDFT